MSDLINGREMLKRYQEDLCYGIACKDCSMCTEDGGCRVEEWIDKFPSADRQQEWIPCSERLPKENTEVLMSLEWGIDIGEHRNGDWHSEWINHYDDGNVLAWMPLPEPWKGVDDEV